MLTPHQQQALQHTRHLSVTANAGSGKTTVLVERYLSILLHGHAAVHEVVALTYTEKAASELKRKISARVARALEESFDPARTRQLEGIREQLSAAFIGTIHSFCARLLREHPVEAGVDAAFSVLEGLDQEVLLQEAITQTFGSVLKRSTGDELRRDVFDLLMVLGKSQVVRYVTTLVEKREQLERWHSGPGIYHGQDADVLALWRGALLAHVREVLSSPVLAHDLEQLLSAAAGKEAQAARECRFTGGDDLSAKAGACLGLINRMVKKDGGLYRSFFGPQIPEQPVAGAARRLAMVRKGLTPLVRYLFESGSDREHGNLLSMTRTLMALAQQAVERYEEMKLEAGRLDFEDLQVRARTLLQRDTVHARLARRFKYIMVDEYQDTNLLQYDILLPLLTGLSTGNLFIVGDPKQSIYGFRNANVALFDRTKRDIREKSGPESQVVLEESFRPLRDLVAFVNLVFAPLMDPGQQLPGAVGANEVSYEPLVQARGNDAPGRVELLLGGGVPEFEDLPEGERIARRIVQLVASRYQIFSLDEQPRDFRFGDVAVLLRSRSLLPELEEAFLRHNIPYMVSGGVGYFQTQDILDFYNYFQFLLDPTDDAALAGVLRSPFFSVSDAELFERGMNRGASSLWQRLRSDSSPGRQGDAILIAVRLLHEDLVVGPTLPVPELIARIVDQTLYRSKVAGTPRGDQALANLQKLQRIALRLDEQGFCTLFDFARRLKRLINEEEKEGQGSIDRQGDAVQIMTVHAAKGLEFPVVVVPELDRQFQYDRSPYVHDNLGMAFSFTSEEGEDTTVPLVSMLSEQSRLKTIAEEKRVFYVACTRARDLLILSGDCGGKRESVTRMNWLLDGLRVDTALSSGILEFRHTTRCLVRSDGGYVGSAIDHILSVHVLRSDELPVPDSPVRRQEEAQALPITMVDPLEAHSRGEIFSASKIRLYHECPSKYYLRYLLGLPFGPGPFVRSEDDELHDEEFPAELRGRVFHAVMQRFGALRGDNRLIRGEAMRILLLEGGLIHEKAATYADEITRLVQGIIRAPFWKEVSAGTEARTEFTIARAAGGDFLHGTIDRLYRGADGYWTVLDYKTDAVDARSLVRKAAAYFPQVDFYALLVSRLFSATVVRTILLFTSQPATPVQRLLGQDDLERIEHEVMSVISRIRNGEFPAAETPCSDCPLLPGGCRNFYSDLFTRQRALHPAGKSSV